MTVPGNVNELLLRTAAAAGGYSIDRSLRFNSADSAYLSRTPGSAGNRRTFTLSFWCKLVSFGTRYATVLGTGTTWDTIWFEDDTFRVFFNTAVSADIKTTQLFRDPSAWYHFLVAVDTTQATASNRIKIYVNGSQITTFSTSSYPSQNYECAINSTNQHTIGRNTVSDARYFDGYLADIYLIDGSALTPSSFGETDATTGVWVPKTPTGLTYGTNGFHLDFADNSSAAALGYDAAGSNDWTVNNISISNGVSTIASATGALPILNTDSTGATVQSGLRSDSNATYLKLAVAGGTASGLNLTDQNVSGRSSSNASITNSGVTGTTSSSKFYGGSANVTNGNYFTTAVHSDFDLGGTWTIEFWAKPDSNATGNEKTIIGYGVNASDGYVIMVGRGGAIFRSNGTSDLQYTGSITDWTHFAFVASGGNTKKIFVNGNLVASGSGTVNASGGYTTYIGSPNIFNSGFRFTGEFQDVRFYNGLAKYSASFIAPNLYYPSLAAGNDSLRDSPTNGTASTGGDAGGVTVGNYCTWNPLKTKNFTLSDGNLRALASNTTTNSVVGTIGVSSGKWYWEVVMVGGSDPLIGICKDGINLDNYPGGDANGWGYYSNGNKYTNSTAASYGASYTTNDVIGVALDMDAGTVTFYKNGTSQGQAYSGLTGTIFPAVGDGGASVAPDLVANFGQRAFAYTAPSGFKALCTANLPAPTIVKPSTVMDVVAYTGTGSALTPTSTLGFNPDLVWIKGRSASTDHALYDAVRGVEKRLESNTTDAEVTSDGGVTAFNSAGFSVGTLAQVNTSSATYASWLWDAGTSNATNTSGTITSTVRANVSAGFSVVTYTGNGSNSQKVGHGLGVKPHMVILKSRSNANDWIVFHEKLTNTDYYLKLNSIAAATSTANILDWENSILNFITPTVNTNSNGYTYVAYCWAPVAGYSTFGSYTGNGSSDGPFVATSMRPRWIMVKRTDTTSNWTIIDTAREGYNVDNDPLYPNLSDAEGTTDLADILSNGFKLRSTDASVNASSGTYVYACFGEQAFKYSRAR